MSSLIFRQATRNARLVSMRALGVRTIMVPSEIKYTASAKATGQGRNGTVKVAEAKSPLDTPITLALPPQMGGSGKGSNPEQLFSAGYAGCFLGALQAMAKQAGKDASNATVEVHTGIGPAKGEAGFALSVEIKVSGADREVVEAAHKFCPYSRALAHGVKPTLTVV